LKVETTSLPGVLVIEPQVFGDSRGFLMETWQAARYCEAGIDVEFCQDNLSRSRKGVLRGLHLQHPSVQAKLVSVLEGEVFDVAVDVRTGSPHFGAWFGIALSADNKRQLYVPEGFAHGFCVTSETALFSYKCSGFYAPAEELSVLWNDPAIGIDWPVADPLLSDKDRAGLPLSAFEPGSLPRYPGG
jgi:dTDP-4-dehydrorhamnose 3,5-epimerase